MQNTIRVPTSNSSLPQSFSNPNLLAQHGTNFQNRQPTVGGGHGSQQLKKVRQIDQKYNSSYMHSAKMRSNKVSDLNDGS